MNRKIKTHPYFEAGIDSYEPLQPWAINSTNDNINSHLAVATSSALHFPTLAELNDEIDGVHAEDGFVPVRTDNNTQIQDKINFGLLGGQYPSIKNDQAEPYNLSNLRAPPVQQPTANKSSPPNLATIMANIISSRDKLFFISFSPPDSTRAEWQLVQVNLQRTLAEHPQALSDGRILVDFYVRHPSDIKFNARNQRYWKEYHARDGRFVVHDNYHLIKPTPNVSAYAEQKDVTPFSQWVYIHHHDIYLHGPFNFAIINGRQSNDRIGQEQWEILSKLSNQYQNDPPLMNLTNFAYSYHTTTQFHTVHQDTAISARMATIAMYSYINDN